MLSETILLWITEYGYLAIFVLMTLGTPLPDEVLLTLAGYLVYEGRLLLIPTMAAAFMGSVSGITLSYGLGRTVGNYLVTKFGPAVKITGDKVSRAHAWYERVGKWGLLFGYLLPGVRHLIAFGAGTSKLPLPVFARFAYPGGFIWSVTVVYLGYSLGSQWTLVIGKIHPNLLIASAVTVALFVLYMLVRHYLHKRK